jgi:hypothetical protein
VLTDFFQFLAESSFFNRDAARLERSSFCQKYLFDLTKTYKGKKAGAEGGNVCHKIK